MVVGGGHDWTIDQSDVLFNAAKLPQVGQFWIVEVGHFYIVANTAGGFERETAGVVKGSDCIKAYLLLATSCDGTLCSTAQFTSVRVVCNNTLQMAVGDSAGAVKVPHSTVFDPQQVKEAPGIGLSGWERFLGNLKTLARRPVSPDEARPYFSEVLQEPLDLASGNVASRAMQQIEALYVGAGMGAQLASACGTAWGLVNAMTQFVDHRRRARSQDYRLDSA